MLLNLHLKNIQPLRFGRELAKIDTAACLVFFLPRRVAPLTKLDDNQYACLVIVHCDCRV